jgi:ABC-type antimicrobial peptide transport system permease subunit
MAASIVAQGIRIRLGRSLVTITGIVLGIAFLVSSLGSSALRRGVAEEDRRREEANRMYGYLVAETGSLAGRSLVVWPTGELGPGELRLLQRLEREKLAEVRVWSKAPALPPGALSQLTPRPFTEPGALGEGASGLLLMGDGAWPAAATVAVVSRLRQPIVAVTREPRAAGVDSSAKLVRLHRDLPDDERVRLLRTKERERFRGLWILVISLLVTVFGISNAMLMSVSERFRDIGTMKCLGATSRFIRQIFLLEASFMGLVGGALGVVLGLVAAFVTYLVLYDAALVVRTLRSELAALALASAQALLAAIVLSVVAALYPARLAARMVPADALRSNV